MKTRILNLTLLSLMTFFSGCNDLIDLSGIGSYNSGIDGWDFNVTFPYGATFYTDSVKQVSDTELTVWAHIQYDSVLIIKNRKIDYWEANGSTITKVIQSLPDTLDFRKLPKDIIGLMGRKEWVYQFTITLGSLKKEVDYGFCVITDYSEKFESKSTSQCGSYRLK